MKTAIIILNWNNAPDTLECLASIPPGYEIYVADNGSTDGSLNALRSAYPQVTYLENGANLGFAEGNNRAIRAALKKGADFLFLLNNDAIINPNTLPILANAAKEHPEAGVFGPKIYYYDAPTTIWYGGGGWNPESASFFHRDWNVEEAIAPQRVNVQTPYPISAERNPDIVPEVKRSRGVHSKKLWMTRETVQDQGCSPPKLGGGSEHLPQRSIEPTGYVCGCALFARAETFHKVGLFDPRFFLIWEEIDWCWRLRKAGLECLYVPESKVWHKVSRSFIGGKSGAMWNYYYWRNRLLWMEKQLPKREFFTLFCKILWPEIRQLLRERSSPQARGSLRGIAHYLLRRFGKNS